MAKDHAKAIASEEDEQYAALQTSVSVAKTQFTKFTPAFTTSKLPTISSDLLESFRQLTSKAEAFSILLRTPLKKAGKKRKSNELDGEREVTERIRDVERKKDWIDTQGVQLWNQAMQLRQSISTMNEDKRNDISKKEVDLIKLLAMVRLAAFRLVEAAMDTRPQAPYLQRILGLVPKTAIELQSAGMTEEATAVLSSGAIYENTFSEIDAHSLDQEAQRGRLKTIIGFNLARVEMEASRSNWDLGITFMKRATELDKTGLLMVPDLEPIIAKCWSVGSSLLHPNTTSTLPQSTEMDETTNRLNSAQRAQMAVNWLRMGLTITDRLENGSPGLETENLKHLKQSLMHGLARALFDSRSVVRDNLTAAEVVIDEILSSDTSDASQMLCSTKLEILRQRPSSQQEILTVFERIIRHLEWTEEKLLCLLSEINWFSTAKPEVIAPALHLILENCLSPKENNRLRYVDKVLLSLLLHLQTRAQVDPKQARAAIETALTKISAKKGYGLGSTEALACAMIIWRIGDHLFASENSVSQAAYWYKIAGSPIFQGGDAEMSLKSRKKLALCMIKAGEHATAQEELEKCNPSDQGVLYLGFLIAVAQGDDTRAVGIVDTIAELPCIDGGLLLMMAEIANETGKPPLVLATLHALTAATKLDTAFPVKVDPLVVQRAIIRLNLGQIDDAIKRKAGASTLGPLWHDLLGQLREGLVVCKVSSVPSGTITDRKELAWFYKTTYNISAKAAGVLDDSLLVATFFDLAVEFMDLYYRSGPPNDCDPLFMWHRALAIYASVTANVMLARSDQSSTKMTSLAKCLEKIELLRSTLRNVPPFQDYAEHLDRMKHVGLVFELEVKAGIKDWEGVMLLFEGIKQGEQQLITCEAIADIVLHTGAPTAVQYACLQSAVEVALRQSTASALPFARWLRAILLLLLHRNDEGDADKILDLIEKAKRLMSSSKDYPPDETDWLLKALWNQGLHALSIAEKVVGRKYLEASLSICQYHQQGDRLKEQMHIDYSRILASS